MYCLEKYFIFKHMGVFLVFFFKFLTLLNQGRNFMRTALWFSLWQDSSTFCAHMRNTSVHHLCALWVTISDFAFSSLSYD